MIESMNNSSGEFYTTGNVAKLCGVSGVTVHRWIKKGYLSAFRLPSGHYRIHFKDFNEFLKKNDIPNIGKQ